jgi:hypothetical protein
MLKTIVLIAVVAFVAVFESGQIRKRNDFQKNLESGYGVTDSSRCKNMPPIPKENLKVTLQKLKLLGGPSLRDSVLRITAEFFIDEGGNVERVQEEPALSPDLKRQFDLFIKQNLFFHPACDSLGRNVKSSVRVPMAYKFKE